jgi:hypothetical protein
MKSLSSALNDEQSMSAYCQAVFKEMLWGEPLTTANRYHEKKNTSAPPLINQKHSATF